MNVFCEIFVEPSQIFNIELATYTYSYQAR